MAVAAFEEQGLPEEAVVLTLLDARRGEWYAGAWRRPRGAPERLESVLAEGLYAPALLATDLAGPVVVAAPDATDWRAAFEPAGLAVGGVIEGVAARPRAAWVGRLGAARLASGEGVAPADLTARYLRRAQAEAVRLGGPVEAGELARVADGDA
jgi:tRNA A37 threonylcarbamoyladenosine modification protein TsaB